MPTPADLSALQAELEAIKARNDLKADDRHHQMKTLRRRIRKLKEALGINASDSEEGESSDSGTPQPQKTSKYATEEERDAAKKARRAARREERRLTGPTLAARREWKPDDPNFPAYVQSIINHLVGQDVIMADQDVNYTSRGYGFDIVHGYEIYVEPYQFLQKFLDRWQQTKPQWFTIARQGPVPILILGPVPTHLAGFTGLS